VAGTTLAGALAFAASAGLATFFAPCAFPLLPGYVGYYLHESDADSRALPAATAGAFGALSTLVVVAVLVLAVGRPVRDALPALEPVIGVALVAFGVLALAGRGPELVPRLPARPSSVLGVGVFGSVYAVAAAGCVVPLFVGVLAQALALPVASSALVVVTYALGVALPLVGVTLLAGAGVDTWRNAGRYAGRIQQVAAVVMILAGLAQTYLACVAYGVPSRATGSVPRPHRHGPPAALCPVAYVGDGVAAYDALYAAADEGGVANLQLDREPVALRERATDADHGFDPRLDCHDVLDCDVTLLLDSLDGAGVRVDGFPETDR